MSQKKQKLPAKINRRLLRSSVFQARNNSEPEPKKDMKKLKIFFNKFCNEGKSLNKYFIPKVIEGDTLNDVFTQFIETIQCANTNIAKVSKSLQNGKKLIKNKKLLTDLTPILESIMDELGACKNFISISYANDECEECLGPKPKSAWKSSSSENSGESPTYDFLWSPKAKRRISFLDFPASKIIKTKESDKIDNAKNVSEDLDDPNLAIDEVMVDSGIQTESQISVTQNIMEASNMLEHEEEDRTENPIKKTFTHDGTNDNIEMEIPSAVIDKPHKSITDENKKESEAREAETLAIVETTKDIEMNGEPSASNAEEISNENTEDNTSDIVQNQITASIADAIETNGEHLSIVTQENKSIFVENVQESGIQSTITKTIQIHSNEISTSSKQVEEENENLSSQNRKIDVICMQTIKMPNVTSESTEVVQIDSTTANEQNTEEKGNNGDPIVIAENTSDDELETETMLTPSQIKSEEDEEYVTLYYPSEKEIKNGSDASVEAAIEIGSVKPIVTSNDTIIEVLIPNGIEFSENGKLLELIKRGIISRKSTERDRTDDKSTNDLVQFFKNRNQPNIASYIENKNIVGCDILLTEPFLVRVDYKSATN